MFTRAKTILNRKDICINRTLVNSDSTIPKDSYELTPRNIKNIIPCYIEAFLAKKMRIHQKEGTKFLFECVTGLRGEDIKGCILADSMGLGKTI